MREDESLLPLDSDTVNSIRRPHAMYRRAGDRVFSMFIVAIGSSIIVLAVAMGVILYNDSSLTFAAIGVFDFITGTEWDPVSGEHGTLPFLFGTVVTSAVALLIAAPVGTGAAIFSAEYAPKPVATVVNYLIDLLAAIPSVVIGLWGIFVFAPWIRDVAYAPIYRWASEHAEWLVPILGSPASYNIATSTLLLSFMVVPYTMALARDSISLVPQEQREAAWGLGATRWEVMRVAVLPAARGGIVAGALLSLARALGETMVVAMIIGNSNRLPFRLFQPAATMPSVIVNEFREAVEALHFTSVMAVGFILFLLTLAINLIAAFLQRRIFGGGTRL